MDAKITRKRLGEMLAYDWIKIMAVIAAAIIVWMLFFQMTGVRLKVGQGFTVHCYGTTFETVDSKELSTSLRNGYLSYDVLDLTVQNIPNSSEANEMLIAKHGVREGDLMLTDDVDSGTQEKPKYDSAFKKMVDEFSIMAFEDLVVAGEEYLAKFYDADGKMMDVVVENHFRTRMKKDNRFRKEKQILLGIAAEKIRIETVKENVAWLKEELQKEFVRIANNQTPLFVRYARNTQAAAKKPSAGYKIGEEKTYGLSLDALEKASEFVRNEDGKCENMMAIVYNYLQYQPDLQFETIAALRCIVDLYGAK